MDPHELYIDKALRSLKRKLMPKIRVLKRVKKRQCALLEFTFLGDDHACAVNGANIVTYLSCIIHVFESNKSGIAPCRIFR